MTDAQKNQITKFRIAGNSYGMIAKELDLPVNTVKSFCRRNNISGINAGEPQAVLATENTRCENCGEVIRQTAKRKPKRFCCDKCRNQWWNAHLDLVKRKAVYKFKCVGCGREFTVYGNANRKYCSHECYIEDRFGGVRRG